MTATNGSAADLTVIPANVYPGTTSRRADGVLTIGGVGVDELAQRHGTPLFVYDEADFRARCAAMAQAFGRYGKVHYAS